MKKIILILLLLLCAKPLFAAWGNWENCRVENFLFNYYYEGNTGNYNLGNVEELYVSLNNCKNRPSAWFSIHVKHPEMGPVKCPNCIYVPAAVMEYYRSVVNQAKETGQTINLSGDIAASGGMTPLRLILNPPPPKLSMPPTIFTPKKP